MAATKPIHNRSFHLGHYLAIVGIAFALVLSAFVVDAVAAIGVLTPTVGVRTGPSIVPPTSPSLSPSASAMLASPTPDLVPAAVPPVTVVVTSLVATGRPELETPKGTFHVMAKFSPIKFVSPWPKGNPYWYPDEWVLYGILFANHGFFLHDAPWRTQYGPGTNLTQGTHGCVNVPKPAMATLYGSAMVGASVVIE